MNRRLRYIVAALAVAALCVWGCCDLKRDPSPVYIPGRDTLVYWNGGTCEIIGEPGFNSLYVGGTQITAHDDFVAAHKSVGDEVFFLTEKGKIAVNLETGAYAVYTNEALPEPAHAAVFAGMDSFEWIF